MSNTSIDTLLAAVISVFVVPAVIIVVYFLSRAVSYGWHMGKFSAIFQRRLHNQEHERISDEP